SSGPRDAQRPAAAQTADQLAFERTSALNVEGLIDGFVGDAHGLVLREVDLQPVGNLFGRPAIDPLTVTAMRLVAALDRCLPRACNLKTVSGPDLARQAVLHVVVQPWVSHQLRRLWSSGHQ